jgi:hypothetical protein
VRRLILLLLVLTLLLVGCGKSKPKASTTPAATVGPAAVLGQGARVIYQSSGWAVVVNGSKAVAAHLVKGTWTADRSGQVKVELLGPASGRGPTPQLAAQLTAKSPLVESSLWIDGLVIPVQGGGTATRGTIYGAPSSPVFPGKHLEVAYARTATHATAVARVFRVTAS